MAQNVVGMPVQPAGVGPVATAHESLTYQTGGSDWARYFGPSSRPIETAQYGAYRRENFALPEAYRGSNQYLTNIIITLVTDAVRAASPRRARPPRTRGGPLAPQRQSTRRPRPPPLNEERASEPPHHHRPPFAPCPCSPCPPPACDGEDFLLYSLSQDLWPVKIALPWRLHETDMVVSWDQIIFDNALLDQVPEEGVSRLVTQQVSERRDHMIRYGLAFMLEHGFMKTEKGRLSYRMNLEQIRNAVLETAYLGVIQAYLGCKSPYVPGGLRTAGSARLTGRHLRAALSTEVEQFAMVQKSEYGFDLLHKAGSKALKLIGVKPNLWILPEGMKMYLNNVRKENFQYAIAGPSKANGGPLETRGGVDITVDVANDCTIVETKSFELPNLGEPIDPMTRNATIGEYYTMFNHLRGSVAPEKYRTAMRDIFLYNEDKDGFTRIALGDALRRCARFDEHDGSIVLTLEDSVAPSADDNPTPPDMFLHRVAPARPNEPHLWTAVERMGDMHRNYLRAGGVDDWCDSVVAKILGEDKDMATKIRRGVELCRRIDSEDVKNNPAYTTWAQWIVWMYCQPRERHRWNEEHDMPLPPTFEDVGVNVDVANAIRNNTLQNLGALFADRNKDLRVALGLYNAAGANNVGGAANVGPAGASPFYGIHDADGRALCLPVGYANWGGLSILANTKYAQMFGDVHTVARDFVQAFKMFYERLRLHAMDSVFTSGAHAPPWCKSRDGINTAFSNLMHHSYGPLWVRHEVNGAANNANALINTPFNFAAAGRTSDGYLYKGLLDAAAKRFDVAYPLQPAQGVDLKERYNVRSDKDSDQITQSYSTVIKNFKEDMRDIFGDVAAQGDGQANILGVIDMVAGLFESQVFASHPRAAELLCRVYQLVKLLSDAAPDSVSEAKIMTAGLLTWRFAQLESFKAVLLNVLHLICYYSERMMGATGANGAPAAVNNRKPWDEIKKDVDSAIEQYDSRAQYFNQDEQNDLKGFTMRNLKDDDFAALTGTESVFQRMYRVKDKYVATPTALTGGVVLAHMLAASYFDEDMKDSEPWGYITVGMDEGNSDIRPLAERTNGNLPARQNERVQGGPAFSILFRPVAQVITAANLPVQQQVPPNGTRVFGAGGGDFGARFGADPGRNLRRRVGEGASARDPMLGGGGYFFGRGDGGARDDTAGDLWGYGGQVPDSFFSESFIKRIHDMFAEETDPIRRALKLAFLGQPVTQAVFSNILARDDVFPFGFLLFRPYMTYAMASAILTVAGSQTGETLVGHADFQLADNVTQKMHQGNFTMYIKSVVYQPHHVWIADNVMACGYIGGNNCTFRKPSDTQPIKDVQSPSMYAVMVPYECQPDPNCTADCDWEPEVPNPLDITGEYSSNPALSNLAATTNKFHYASARYYARAFGWSNDEAAIDTGSMGVSNLWNTLCFSGHQNMYSPRTGLYDLVRTSRYPAQFKHVSVSKSLPFALAGASRHWPSRIANVPGACLVFRNSTFFCKKKNNTAHMLRNSQGCGRVWRGLAKLLEPVNYNSEMGGAAQRTLTTLAV